MALLDYTSYDEIRALLGVSDEELEDETLALPVYYTGLLEDFATIDLRLQGIIDALPDPADQTPLQARVYRLSQLFSSYSVARQLCPALPMFAPRSVADGKASMSRFIDPYKDTIKGVESGYSLNFDRLLQALLQLLAEDQQTVSRTFFLGVGLARDPVTQG